MFCILQEFHIGDSEHCSKEEFMNQLSHYSGDTNIVQAVFFSKVTGCLFHITPRLKPQNLGDFSYILCFLQGEHIVGDFLSIWFCSDYNSKINEGIYF